MASTEYECHDCQHTWSANGDYICPSCGSPKIIGWSDEVDNDYGEGEADDDE
jgi:Zn finger protein HypA/HybF involved in hydrogenase expression